jgi:hypothetical protein
MLVDESSQCVTVYGFACFRGVDLGSTQVGMAEFEEFFGGHVTIHTNPFHAHAAATSSIQHINSPKQNWAMKAKKERKNSRFIACPPVFKPPLNNPA